MRRPFLPGGLPTTRKTRATTPAVAATPYQRAVERAARLAFVQAMRDACLPLWRITPNFSRAWQVLLMSAVMAVAHIPAATPAQAASGITATVNAGVLTVTGSAGDDVIEIRDDVAGNVKINGADPETGSVTTSSLTSIAVNGGDGNDTIDTSIQRPGSISGGSGRDLLIVYANGEIVLGNSTLNVNTVESNFDTFEQAKLWGPVINGTLIYDAANSPVPVEMVMRSGNAVFTGSPYNDRFVGISGDGVISDVTPNDGDTVAYEGAGGATAGNSSLNWDSGALIYNGVTIANLNMIGDDSDNRFDASAFPGNTVLDGRGGNDTLIGGVYNDYFFPGTGNGNVILDATNGDADRLMYQEDGDITLTQPRLFSSTGTQTIFNGVDFSLIVLSGGESANVLDASNYSSRETVVELYGAAGNDTLIGADASNLFDPGTGIDVLSKPIDNATDNDQIIGRTSANLKITSSTLAVGSSVAAWNGFSIELASLYGNDGANIIDAGLFTGSTIADGGKGDDIITGGLGNDILSGGEGKNTLRMTSNVDIVFAGSTVNGLGSDSWTNFQRFELTGGAGANRIDLAGFTGNGATFVIDGAGGDDTIIGSPFADSINGGVGNDTITAGSGDDTITAGSGDDTITGGLGNDTINGGDGGDLMRVTADADITLTATQVVGEGTDTFGNIEQIELNGGASNNRIDASAYGQAVRTTTRVISNPGVTIHGMNGDDTIIGSNGDDTLDGGVGVDTLVQTVGGAQTLSDTQATGRGTDTISNFEKATLTGGSGNDTIDASAFNGDTMINGLAGDDTITSGSGDDIIDGGDGFDTLNGGAGNNTLSNGEVAPTQYKVFIPSVQRP